MKRVFLYARDNDQTYGRPLTDIGLGLQVSKSVLHKDISFTRDGII